MVRRCTGTGSLPTVLPQYIDGVSLASVSSQEKHLDPAALGPRVSEDCVPPSYSLLTKPL